jgi:hypothetical protein
MAYAKLLNVPVIALAPLGGHYYRDKITYLGQTIRDWRHPFVEGLSDIVVPTVSDLGRVLREFQLADATLGVECFNQAIGHYLATQLKHDRPMADLIERAPAIRQRIEAVEDTVAVTHARRAA